jgi:hypothetical protein
MTSCAVDLVVAHYHEDLSWLRDATEFATRIRFFVYHKGGEDLAAVASRCPPGTTVTALPNVGREADTYLAHFVAHREAYAQSPDTLVLCCQGDVSPHIIDGAADDVSTYLRRLVEDARAHGRSETTARAHRFGAHSAVREFRILEWGGSALVPWSSTFGEWFERLVGPFPEPEVRWWAGATFCVRAGNIASRPPGFFEAIRETLDGVSPETAHFAERSWFHMLDGSTSGTPIDKSNRELLRMLRMLTVTSPNYQSLYDVFSASLRPDDHGIDLETLVLEPDARGTFGTAGWNLALLRKIEFVCRELIHGPEGERIVVSDADIQYFAPERLRELVERAAADDVEFYGMTEGGGGRRVGPKEFNGGFYVVKRCPAVRALFSEVARVLSAALQDGDYPEHGDQTVLNRLLGSLPSPVRSAHIPTHLYVWGEGRPDPTAIFHHAVVVLTIDDKLSQMRRVRAAYEAHTKPTARGGGVSVRGVGVTRFIRVTGR